MILATLALAPATVGAQAVRSRATGAPLDAIVFDVDWRQPWQAVVASGVRVAHQAGVRAGIFITGTGPGASDAEAVAARKQNIQAVGASGLKFDLVDVANWTPHPSRNLPESAAAMRWRQNAMLPALALVDAPARVPSQRREKARTSVLQIINDMASQGDRNEKTLRPTCGASACSRQRPRRESRTAEQ